MKHILLSLLLLASFGTRGVAQADHWWQEWHFQTSSSIDHHSFTVQSEAGVLSNTISSATANALIRDEVVTADLTGELALLPSSNVTRIHAGMSTNAWVRLTGKGALSWHFGAGVRDQVVGTVGNGLAQLALLGNGAFEDKSLTLGNTRLEEFGYQYVSAGVDHRSDQVVVGAALNLIKAGRWKALTIDDGTLYTAPYGTSIDVYLDGSYSRSGTTQSRYLGWYGTGASLNAFLTTRPSSEHGWMFTAQVRDLGLIHFAGSQQRTLYIDTLFKGAPYQFGQGSALATEGMGAIDSLDQSFFTQGHTTSRSVFLPGRMDVQLIHRFGDKLSLAMGLQQYFRSVPPQLRGGLSVSPTTWFSFEPHITMGGFSKLDAGLTLVLDPSDNAAFVLQYRTLDGLVQPTRSTSNYASLTFRIRWD